MCHQITEHYLDCNCVYYQHAVERCADYGPPSHPIRRKKMPVHGACHEHTLSPADTFFGENSWFPISPPPDIGSTVVTGAKSTPKLRLKPRPGTSRLGVSCHSTISKDCTAGEGARKAELLACFGRRLRGGRGVGNARRSGEKPRVESVDMEDGDTAAEYEYESKLVRDTHLGQRHRDINPQNVLNFVPSPMAESGRD
ncbi:hypothetical protein CPLU01_10197, partial [Colletotrichum plurivorum]